MSWLYSPPRNVTTKHNGTMRLHRLFGVWRLMGEDGSEQASPYMDGVWKKTLRAAARRGMRPARCLVLGVAMGSTFNLLRRRWPDAEIVGIDWEPALYALGRELGVFRGDARTTFVEGDAAVEVPRLDGTFDLALVDLFNGHRVADAVRGAALREALAAKIAPGGIVAVNYYRQPDAVRDWNRTFGGTVPMRYRSNGIALYVRK